MAIVAEVLVGALLLIGCLLNLTAAIGLHRFPDVFCRMHAATKPATMGLLCVLAGAAIAIGDVPSATKLGLVALLQPGDESRGRAHGRACRLARWHDAAPGNPRRVRTAGAAAGSNAGAALSRATPATR